MEQHLRAEVAATWHVPPPAVPLEVTGLGYDTRRMRVLHFAAEALVQQVGAHCSERASALLTLWNLMVGEFEDMIGVREQLEGTYLDRQLVRAPCSYKYRYPGGNNWLCAGSWHFPRLSRRFVLTCSGRPDSLYCTTNVNHTDLLPMRVSDSAEADGPFGGGATDDAVMLSLL